ncbi:MAG TPA: hemerythrin domain-containing protein [Rhizomicrobium sp.]|nr:hemerythrin domain-containing protein [Rhizomicrobium sp.]
MPTKRQSTSTKHLDAIALLMQDHRDVEKMFKDFDKAGKADDERGKADAVHRICVALTAHAEIEEEIFYPAARKAIEEEDMMDEAEVEHAGIKGLVEELKEMSPGDNLYDAKVTVLMEYVKHHVKEEESEMFPKVRKAKLDLAELGTEMSQRKQEVVTAAAAE